MTIEINGEDEKKIYLIKDSERLELKNDENNEDISLSIGDDPINNNFCLKKDDLEEETDESYYSKASNQNEHNQDEHNANSGRISYYAGLVYLNFSSGAKQLLLYSKCRFNRLSVTEMINTIMSDPEIKSYLSTGHSQKKYQSKDQTKDQLVIIDRKKEIQLSEYNFDDESLKSVTSEGQPDDEGKFKKIIIEEYKAVRKLEKKESCDDGKTIHPYTINLALLFELYARIYIKTSIKKNESTFIVGESKNWEMKAYVPDKSNDNSDNNEDQGKLSICKVDNNKFYLDGTVVPDIVLYDGNEYIILDAKYKDPTNRQDRDDRLQILAYAFMYGARQIGHVFPMPDNFEGVYPREYKLNDDKATPYKMFFLHTKKCDDCTEEDN